ncbi:Cysteine desulfurase [Pirellula sp. SH-Sr6A]|uniref:cysteine desulfurase n=1 Tax=Pirellula sp. SH-Sr6A TaxID=1632865 RepID=UPI00078C53CE|nr:cysteine desulfurase [Pirellula sp. SH-Sr6A]AMV33602.1 Cysteine desulfurase [Pirellula sp. SH-Sr6A]
MNESNYSARSTERNTSIDATETNEISSRLLNQIFGTEQLSRIPGSLTPADILYAEELTAVAPTEPAVLPEPVRRAIERVDSKRFPQDITDADIQRTVRSLQSESEAALHRKVNFREQEQADSSLNAPKLQRDAIRKNKSKLGAARTLDVRSVRSDFPALHQDINGHSLVWFDNGATTHKPIEVIETLSRFYACDYSNIHRAAHTLAARATDHYELARETVREFVHAQSTNDIVFVRGTTEGINFIAQTCKSFLKEGDEVLLTEMEHHANIVPWQLLADELRLRIRVIPFNDDGDIMMDEYRRLLTHKTKIVSVTHASNTLGTILPVEEMASMAHRKGARFVIDGAQSVAHLPIDVQSLGCDFFVFSGHKVFAPTGIGVVYIHPDLQELLPPWQGGGNMIHRVSFDGTTFSDPPAKFEAGTPSIGDAVGLGAALRYLMQFDSASLLQHEHSLLEHASTSLQSIPGVTTLGRSRNKVGLVSFVLDRYTTDQVGKELDRQGIAVRTGHHCAQPSLRHFGLESTVRPSFALYNTHEEIDRMIEVIHRLARKA